MKKWLTVGTAGFLVALGSVASPAGAQEYPPSTLEASTTSSSTTTTTATTTTRVIPSSGPPTSLPGQGTQPTSLPGNGNTTTTVVLVAATAGSTGTTTTLAAVAVGAATEGQLPTTGSDSSAPLMIGTGLIVAGLSAVAITRRRRPATAL